MHSSARVVLLVGDLGRLKHWIRVPRWEIVWLGATGTREALHLATAVSPKPDVVFISLILEQGNGHDACIALRATLGAATPILLVSARRREVDRQYAGAIGATGLLPASEREQFLTDLEELLPDWT